MFIIVLTAILSVNLHAQENEGETYFKKANEFFDSKDYKTAILYCDSTILSNAGHEEAYAFRGVCKYFEKQFSEAIKDFDLALILVPGYAEVYFYRGLSYLELENNKKACDDFTEAYNLGFKKAMKLIVKHCEIEENKAD